MGYPTNIEWTDATWNPIGGCEVHSPGCINCYAQSIAGSGRLRDHPLYRGVTKTVKGKPVFNGMLTALPDGHPAWNWPLRWRGAKHPRLGDGKPSLIFVGDMSDLFHHRRPVEHIDRTVATILLSNHIGQLLTKRPDRMAEYFADLALNGRMEGLADEIKPAPSGRWVYQAGPEHNLWVGFSAERQREMDDRAPHMRRLAAAGWQVFVSIEPMLERIVLPSWFGRVPRKVWIIVGGESGRDARPMHPDWVREVRDQAAELGCPFFFKQWGERQHETQPGLGMLPFRVIEKASLHVWPDDFSSALVGKKRSGRQLDGREHNAFPEAA